MTSQLGFYAGPTAKYDPLPELYVDVQGGIRWRITYASKELMDLVKENWEFTEGLDNGKRFIEATIPEQWAGYRASVRKVLTCGYEAADKYMHHNLGMRLDGDDKNWYICHPKCNEHGLPQQYTLSVINDLVRPYGVGISRVFINKGRSFSEDMMKWTKYLQPNPMAMSDRTTTNEEYCRRVYGSTEYLPEVDNEFRMEFVDRPRGPVMLFASSSNVTIATGGGHASYAGPRAKIHSWIMAVQLDKVENILYLEAPEEEDYEPLYAKELDIWQCLARDGRPLNSHRKPLVVSTKYVGTTSLPPANQTSYQNRHGITKREFDDFSLYYPGFLIDADFLSLNEEPFSQTKLDRILSNMQALISKVGTNESILNMAGCKLGDLHKSDNPRIISLKEALLKESNSFDLSLVEILLFYRKILEDRSYDILWALSDEPIENMLYGWGQSSTTLIHGV